MASLEDAFITQISNMASARNPNAYLANQQVATRQQPEWHQQFQNSISNTSFEWQQHNQHNLQQNWLQPQQQEWLTPKQSVPTHLLYQSQSMVSQPQNDNVSPQQAAAQIAHQHRFQPNELKLVSDDPTDTDPQRTSSLETHWWFIRTRTGTEYCYPKHYSM
jgi:hypothetical protein